jgi:hypothetical protein
MPLSHCSPRVGMSGNTGERRIAIIPSDAFLWRELRSR